MDLLELALQVMGVKKGSENPSLEMEVYERKIEELKNFLFGSIIKNTACRMRKYIMNKHAEDEKYADSDKFIEDMERYQKLMSFIAELDAS